MEGPLVKLISSSKIPLVANALEHEPPNNNSRDKLEMGGNDHQSLLAPSLLLTFDLFNKCKVLLLYGQCQ